jgi:hypothetical protein
MKINEDLIIGNTSTSLVDLYTQTNNLKGKILWTNPNPLNEFAAQTITLNSDDYDVIEVFYCSNVLSSAKTYEFKRSLKGYNITLSTIVNNVNTYRTITYNNAKSLTVNIGYSNAEEQARRCIPVYIIGYKTGLF